VDREETASSIPNGRDVIVIDLGDSPLAPHQAAYPAGVRRYYCRSGGHSIPAPHHYLEALRNRLTCGMLEVELVSVSVRRVLPDPRGNQGRRSASAVAELRIQARVRNVGRIACYRWAVGMGTPDEPPWTDILVRPEECVGLGKSDGMRIDWTVLPGGTDRSDGFVGVRIPAPDSFEAESWDGRLLDAVLQYWVVTENFVGEIRRITLREIPGAMHLGAALSRATNL
jgi:hypothetical protein